MLSHLSWDELEDLGTVEAVPDLFAGQLKHQEELLARELIAFHYEGWPGLLGLATCRITPAGRAALSEQDKGEA